MATGLPLVTYGLAEIGSTGGFTSVKVIVPILLGLALVGAFVLRALRVPRPLLNVRLYRKPTFSSAYGTAFWGVAGLSALAIVPCIVLMRAEAAARRAKADAAASGQTMPEALAA